MKLELNSRFDEYADRYLREREREKITQAAVERYGSFEGLTIGQWISCSSGNLECVLGDDADSWGAVYWFRAFVEWAKKWPETLASLSPKMDADEQRAASELMQSTLAESVLVFTRNYFGLRSFKEAEGITLGEVLIAKKAAYNDAMFQRKYSKIQLEKAKQRR